MSFIIILFLKANLSSRPRSAGASGAGEGQLHPDAPLPAAITQLVIHNIINPVAILRTEAVPQ